MAELKTKKTKASAIAFIKSIPDEEKRKDSLALNSMYSEVTGLKPIMWGTSIVGYGMYHYESKRSSQKGDWPLAAFSPRKQTLTLYVYPGYLPAKLFKNLGPHSTSKGCLYIKRLSDVDTAALKQIIRASYSWSKKNLGQ